MDTSSSRPRFLTPSVIIFVWLLALNAALLVTANAAGAKMIALFGGLVASATVFPYALTFVFTDVVSELYGKKAGRLAVLVGFAGLLLSVVFFNIALWAPPASFWDLQDAYEATLGPTFRLMLGGWTSYLVSQHLDVYLFHFFKKLTRGKHLWFRNNASTLISQFVDTCIFITIAFYGVFPLANAIAGQYLIKVIIAAVDTPVVYLAVHYLRPLVSPDQDNQESAE